MEDDCPRITVGTVEPYCYFGRGGPLNHKKNDNRGSPFLIDKLDLTILYDRVGFLPTGGPSSTTSVGFCSTSIFSKNNIQNLGEI